MSVFKDTAFFCCFLLLTTLLSTTPAIANRGMIPFKPGVELYEPNQRAMIAWNGNEEILVLSTDVSASQATKVLEILPVPAEPTVKKGDPDLFEKATNLINKHIRDREAPAAKGERSLRNAFQSAEPAGEVTFHEKIGPHDISVTHVLNAEGFFDWARDYLRQAGADGQEIPDPMKKVIDGYIRKGFVWFVYDVVELSNTLKTNSPIQYQFKSSYIYYPLKITQTSNKDSNIRLLILSPKQVNTWADLPIEQVSMRHDPIDLTGEELLLLNPDMAQLLGNGLGMKLRIWEVHKRTHNFTRDLIAY